MNAPTQQHSAEIELNRILEAQRSAFKAEGPVALETRVDRIDRCIAMLVDSDNDFFHGHFELACSALHDANIGLVRNEPINVRFC